MHRYAFVLSKFCVAKLLLAKYPYKARPKAAVAPFLTFKDKQLVCSAYHEHTSTTGLRVLVTMKTLAAKGLQYSEYSQQPVKLYFWGKPNLIRLLFLRTKKFWRPVSSHTRVSILSTQLQSDSCFSLHTVKKTSILQQPAISLTVYKETKIKTYLFTAIFSSTFQWEQWESALLYSFHKQTKSTLQLSAERNRSVVL